MVAEQVEFADVEPVAVAVRAGIDLYLMAAAVKVTAEIGFIAPGAGALAAVVDVNERVDGDVQEGKSLGDVGSLEFLELEGVEPDAAAATGTGVHGEVRDGDGFQAMGADGAVHSAFRE